MVFVCTGSLNSTDFEQIETAPVRKTVLFRILQPSKGQKNSFKIVQTMNVETFGLTEKLGLIMKLPR